MKGLAGSLWGGGWRGGGELFEEGDEVEVAAEEEGEGEGVEADGGGGAEGLEAGGGEELVPLALAEVIVRKGDAVRAVPYPIHETQGGVIEFVRGQVIFDEDKVAAHAGGIAQDFFGLGGVVQDVDEHAAIEGIVVEGEMRAVEEAARNGALGARVGFDPLYFEAWNAGFEIGGEVAVAAPDVEDAGVGRDEGREVGGEDGDAAGVNDAAVNGADELGAGVRRWMSI